jgi:hypothetical protein
MKDFVPVNGITDDRPDQEIWNTVGCFPLLNNITELAQQLYEWQRPFLGQNFSSKVINIQSDIEEFCYDLFAKKHKAPSEEVLSLPITSDDSRCSFSFDASLDGTDLEQAVR